jgi:hypothetical protein
MYTIKNKRNKKKNNKTKKIIGGWVLEALQMGGYYVYIATTNSMRWLYNNFPLQKIKDWSIVFVQYMTYFFYGIKWFFTDFLKPFYTSLLWTKDAVLYLADQFWKFILFIINDINTYKLNSNCLRVILLLVGILLSFFGIGQVLTVTHTVNVFGTNGLAVGWMANISGFIGGINIFNIIGSIFGYLQSVLGLVGDGLLFLFTGPPIVVSLTQGVLLSGVSLLTLSLIGQLGYNIIESNEYTSTLVKTNNFGKAKEAHNKALVARAAARAAAEPAAAPAAAPAEEPVQEEAQAIIPGQVIMPSHERQDYRNRYFFGGHGKKKSSLKEKLPKISKKNLKKKFKSIPKEQLDKLKNENLIEFKNAIQLGFIKETDEGYEFSDSGINTFLSIINSSLNAVNKHCPKGSLCDSSLQGEPSEDDLTIADLLEIKELIGSLEFIHMASIHGIIREREMEEQEEEKKGGGRKPRVKKFDIPDTMKHIKPEDIEWLKNKYPVKFESARKMGLVKNDFEITSIAVKVVQESEIINGINITATLNDPIPPQ